MSENVASDVARLLAAEGFGVLTTPATIYANTYPATPDNIIAVHAMPGGNLEDTFGGVKQRTYNLQTLVRNSSQTPGATTAHAVWTFLNRFRGTIEDWHCSAILAGSPPFSIGRDENDRWQWSCNYRLWRRS